MKQDGHSLIERSHESNRKIYSSSYDIIDSGALTHTGDTNDNCNTSAKSNTADTNDTCYNSYR